ncbi:MAG: RidA family protein [Actinomycetota bacterium]|nr:RidA family protein [Actinomycetota bacterium]
MTSPHEIINPDTLAAPSGFSHAVSAAPGRTVFLGGQTAHDAKGDLGSPDLVEQFDAAARNVVTALAAAGARPEHLVSMQIFVVDVQEYRSRLSEIGRVYRDRLGTHYPAAALFEIKGLFDPAAKVELLCTAVVPF